MMKYRTSHILFLVMTLSFLGLNAHGKPGSFYYIQQAKIVSIDNTHEKMTYASGTRRFKRSIRPEFTSILKSGSVATLSAFKQGELIVLLSYYPDFDTINILTDRTTYAAYLHDFTHRGTIESLNANDHSFKLHYNAYPILHNDVTQLTETIYVTHKTRIWISGKHLTKNLDFDTLKIGMQINVSIRYEDYFNLDRTTAHSIFDTESFLPYAKSELLHASGLFRRYIPKKSKHRPND